MKIFVNELKILSYGVAPFGRKLDKKLSSLFQKNLTDTAGFI